MLYCYHLLSMKFAWIPQNHHIGSMRVEVRPRNVKLWNKFPCSAKYRLRWLPTSCLIGCRARMDANLIGPRAPYGSTIPFPHGDLYKPWKSRQNVRCIEIRMHFVVAPDGLESKASENRKPVPRCAKMCQEPRPELAKRNVQVLFTNGNLFQFHLTSKEIAWGGIHKRNDFF